MNSSKVNIKCFVGLFIFFASTFGFGLTLSGHAAQRGSTSREQKPVIPKTTQPDEAATRKINEAYGRIPLSFEPNQGQTDPQVRFLARGGGYSLYLTPAEAVFVLKRGEANKLDNSKPGANKPVSTSKKSEVLRLRLAGGNRKAAFEGLEETDGKSNYFIGSNQANWHTDISQYAKVKMKEVYPGIDMVYYGNQGRLEYDFVVKPGADSEAIKLDYQGARNAEVDAQGNLVFHMGKGNVAFKAPVAYQLIGGEKKSIDGRYVIAGNNRIGFRLGNYDLSRELVIDPQLDYSTYVGGIGGDYAYAIVVDSSGNAYIAGAADGGYPTTAGAYQTIYGTGVDAVVTKLNATGTGLLYSTFLGGAGGENAYGIAVDVSGNVYLTGNTDGGGFPTSVGAYQVLPGGSTDTFITKLNATGTGLLYSTYLGGTGDDFSKGIAIDLSGNAYVAGATTGVFPTTVGAYQMGFGGGYEDAFVVKLNATGTGLLYSTYLGGSGDEVAAGIALDSSGNAYLAGSTTGNFPTSAGAYQALFGGGVGDGFVTKLNATGTGLIYSTYLGGNANEGGLGIAVDSSDYAYVVGETAGGFPTSVGAYQTIFGGGVGDGFVTKLNATGTGLIYSTYLGGTNSDFEYGGGIVVDPFGNAYVTGATYGSFPTSAGAYQTIVGGGTDAVVAEFNATGTGLLYSTYLGGSVNDEGNGIALDPSGNVYVAGLSEGNFPTSVGAYQTNYGGGAQDAFAVKLDATAFGNPTPTPTNCGAGTALDLSWSIKSLMPTKRKYFGTGVVNGLLYAVGGYNDDDPYIRDEVEAYDPITNSWTAKAPLPAPCEMLGVGVVNGILYAIAGFGNSGSTHAVLAYDPIANSWTVKAPIPTTRGSFGVCVVNGIIYAIGGVDSTADSTSVEAYDPVANSWTTKQPMPTPRYGLMVGEINGIIYAVGGANNSSINLNTVEAYNPVTDSWDTSLAQMPTGRRHLSGGVVGGILYAIGGANNTLGILKTVEAYDPATDTWSARASMPSSRLGLSVGVVNEVLYALGGEYPGNANFNEAAVRACVPFTPTVTATRTNTSTHTPVVTSTATFTSTATLSPTQTSTRTATATPTTTSTSSSTAVSTDTPTSTPSPTFTSTPTPTVPGLNVPVSGQTFLYPSPAIGNTATVAYYMAQAGTVKIKVWNSAMELVAEQSDVRGAGPQSSTLNLNNFAPGVYLYRVEMAYGGGASERLAVKQFVVVR